MSITRRLPRTNAERWKALDTAWKKKVLVALADLVLTPSTIGRLDAIHLLYKAAMLLVGTTLAAQADATETVKLTIAEARMYITHFFKTFNDSIERKVFKASDRGFYLLDINDNTVPSLATEADVILWGERIKDGDAARVLAGGAAMAMPSAAEVDVKLQLFITANNDQGLKKTAYDQAQEAVNDLNTEADAVIKKMWDEAETFYNEQPAPSMRRKCREWGVIYISDIPNIIHLTVLNVADDSPIFEADAEVTETGDHFTTDGAGKTDVKTNVEDHVSLHIIADNFIANDTVVDFSTGGHEFAVTVKLTHV